MFTRTVVSLATRRLAKIDDTAHSIRQALDRAWSEKQSRARMTAEKMGQLDQRLTEIHQAESKLCALKERIDKTVT